LGRVIAQTNALGGVTTTAYGTNGNQTYTITTNPDGGTSVTTNCTDGQPQSTTGTAAEPVQYQYGAEQDGNGGPWRQLTVTVKLSATGGTNEWTKSYTDGAGRQYKTVYPRGASSVSYYNALGQVTKQVDPDGVSKLFQYDDQGRQCVSAIDMEGSGAIDFVGTDRITLTTNDVAFDRGANVNRRQVFAWSTNGSATSNLVSTTETSVEGLTNWSTTWNGTVGLTTTSATVYSGANTRTVTVTAPDGSYTVSAYRYGQLQSSTRYDANGSQIAQTSYGYDAHWRRNAVTDARTGTTTSWFNNMDQVSGTATPPPASGQSPEVTTNYFDLSGRVVKTTLPDGTSVTNAYYPTGLAAMKSGSRTYPVGYAYDAQGRMTTMTNWSGFASGSGVEVTTWN
jgi:hypothetical protein